MEQTNAKLRELINTPLVLLTLTDQKTIEEINNFLPYSVGFEIECNQLSIFNIDNFKIIPDIMSIDCDSHEQRFRIPNGIKGMICLYNICEQLRINSELNPKSGIHYHIDFTDSFHLINNQSIKKNADWILDELNEWNTADLDYGRTCLLDSSGWVRFQTQHKTMEVRIGEMSFNYKLIIGRMIQCNEIARKLKSILGCEVVPQYQQLDNKPAILEQLKRNKVKDKTLQRLTEKLTKLQFDNSDKGNTYSEELMNYTINNRIVKI